MNLDKLHKIDLPDEISFNDKIAIDCEFTGLNLERDRLCLIQISSRNKTLILFSWIKIIMKHKSQKILSDKNK